MNEPKITLVATADTYSLTFEVDGRVATRIMKRESPGLMRGGKGDWYDELGKIVKNEDLIEELGEALEKIGGAGFEASQVIQDFGESYSRVDDLKPLKKVPKPRP